MPGRSMSPSRLFVNLTLAAAAAVLLGAASGPGNFDDSHYPFAFQFDPGWIPVFTPETETVTFSLAEGEIYVSAGRDPNPHHLKTRAELADEQIQTWKNRSIDFTKLERKDVTLGTFAATEVTGVGKLYDDEQPFKLDIYEIEKDGHLYTLKFSGPYDPQEPYWEGFQRLVKSFRFRDPALAPKNTPAPTPWVPAATPTPPSHLGPDSSWSDKGD